MMLREKISLSECLQICGLVLCASLLMRIPKEMWDDRGPQSILVYTNTSKIRLTRDLKVDAHDGVGWVATNPVYNAITKDKAMVLFHSTFVAKSKTKTNATTILRSVKYKSHWDLEQQHHRHRLAPCYHDESALGPTPATCWQGDE